jgi:hypothetical protein
VNNMATGFVSVALIDDKVIFPLDTTLLPVSAKANIGLNTVNIPQVFYS